MPVYAYRLSGEVSQEGCAFCKNGFEQVQRMSDRALSACPQCGALIERAIFAPMLGNIENKLSGPSDRTLQKAGFTKFKRNGKGHYEKLYGNGPGRIGN